MKIIGQKRRKNKDSKRHIKIVLFNKCAKLVVFSVPPGDCTAALFTTDLNDFSEKLRKT